jgi:hypothetical protein
MTLHEPEQKTETTAADPPLAAGHAEQQQPIDRVIFGVSAALVVAFVVWGIASTGTLSSVSAAVLSAVITGGGWAFVLVASGFVVFALWLAFSRYGRIPLGADDEEPEFRTVSWIAMMFWASAPCRSGPGCSSTGCPRSARCCSSASSWCSRSPSSVPR